MQEQCDKMMMQKFGRIVDLEILETVTVNRQLEELKEKLRLLELQCARETAKWDVSTLQQIFIKNYIFNKSLLCFNVYTYFMILLGFKMY